MISIFETREKLRYEILKKFNFEIKIDVEWRNVRSIMTFGTLISVCHEVNRDRLKSFRRMECVVNRG